jgi:hypothetical protein
MFVAKVIMNLLAKYGPRVQGRWLGLLYLYLALLGWHGMSAGATSIRIAWLLLLGVLVAFVVGDIVLTLLLRDKAPFDTLSFRLLSGTLTAIVLLYVAALALPFGLALDAALLAGAAAALWLLLRRGNWAASLGGAALTESSFLLLALVAVTLWCGDLLQPIASSNGVTTIPAWPDVFYHLSQITAFSGSAGAASLHDVQMAGVVAHPYHFASYVFPGLLVSAGPAPAWVAYAGFLVPVSILLTFLAAQALAAPLLGAWPAAVGALALLLLPDAWQQGFGNPFMAYHWLQQVGPGGGYGVAGGAMAFLLMFEACRTQRLGLLAASYAFLLVTLVFKAHIFVALAFPLWVFPALFFGGLSRLRRVALFLVMSAIFIGVVRVSQWLPGVPVMRLDGSGLATFAPMLLKLQVPGLIKDLFTGLIPVTAGHGLAFALMLVPVTLGVFPLVYALLLGRLRRSVTPVVWLFPILAVGTFLVMATGLALDDRHIGTPEELLHRTFVWPYCVLLVWTVAGAYRLCWGDAAPGKRALPWGVAVAALLLGPAQFADRIQTMSFWSVGHPVLQDCLVRSAAFVTQHSAPADIVQASDNDPKFILTALSARRAYAIDTGGVRAPPGIGQRLQALGELRRAPTLAQASAMARQMGITWSVVVPRANVAWGADARGQAAFSCDNYQVFRF